MEPNLPTPTLTHPATAWLVNAVPLWLLVALILALTLLLRVRLVAAARAWLTARLRRTKREAVDSALYWTPEVIGASQLVAACIGVVLLVSAGLSLLAPLWLAVLLALPLTLGLIMALVRLSEQVYSSALDRDLSAAVGLLELHLQTAATIRPALQRVLAEMDHGPLQREWCFLLEKLGARLLDAPRMQIATPAVVFAALAAQTPSPRHAALLGHLAAAADQSEDLLLARVRAAYAAINAADRRRSAASAELAYTRYSGLAVGLAALLMNGYLAATQWERFTLAYGGPLGIIVGPLVGLALLAPVIGGLLLSRVEDLDY